MIRFLLYLITPVIFLSCAVMPDSNDLKDQEKHETIIQNNTIIDIKTALENSQIPEEIINKILDDLNNKTDFIDEIEIILKQDKFLWLLVDKKNPLDKNYVPRELILLKSQNYSQNRDNQYLAKEAADSLEEMAKAARKDRLTLTVSSAYRSYSYQEEVYSRNVRQMGMQAADRVSAKAGYSQHQLGSAVDFGSITNAFASTGESKWLSANAAKFGWSLSYPENMENITGYSWESWHYRYVGIEVCAFIDKYFEGIQQHALKFLREYKK